MTTNSGLGRTERWVMICSLSSRQSEALVVLEDVFPGVIYKETCPDSEKTVIKGQ